jgi:hypothetical protein
MKLRKLFSAGIKLGGAAASGAAGLALLSIGGGGGENLSGTGWAVVTGLGTGTLLLTGQAIGDVVEAFQSDKE